MWYYISYLYRTQNNIIFGTAETKANSVIEAIENIKNYCAPKSYNGVVDIGFSTIYYSEFKLEKAK